MIAAAVIVHDGRLLLIRRRVAEGSLDWQLPAGMAEEGEPLYQAAAREALEEAGVTVEPVSFLGERVHPATGWRIGYVACRLVSGTARVASPREVAEVAWAPLGQLREYIPGGLYPRVQTYLDSIAD